MAVAIGRAKAKVASTGDKRAAAKLDTAALLDELEHLVDGMMEIAGGGVATKSVGACKLA